jgi:dephospho-CoA kinase
MFIVGVTGGIGSGKTTVTRLFEQRGVVVVDADVIARHTLERGSQALQAVRQRYGEVALQADGSLNRAWLRAHIFANPTEKQWLNQLTHPLIRAEIIKQLHAATSAYVMLSAPLLIENGLHQLCQRVLVVDVDEATQLQRTAERDQVNPQQVQAIMQAQASRQQRLAHATEVLDNSGSSADLPPQVEKLHQLYSALALQ